MITYSIGLADLSVWRHDALWEWLRMTEYVGKKKRKSHFTFSFSENLKTNISIYQMDFNTVINMWGTHDLWMFVLKTVKLYIK